MTSIEDDEREAAKLLRNPCNFEPLLEAFEASKETSTRGKLDDALKALARSALSQGQKP